MEVIPSPYNKGESWMSGGSCWSMVHSHHGWISKGHFFSKSHRGLSNENDVTREEICFLLVKSDYYVA